MSRFHVAVALTLSWAALSAQQTTSPSTVSLSSSTTLPVIFRSTVSADHSHIGDPVLARTTQAVRLDNGSVVAAGASVKGHIAKATPFLYNKTPYAQQKESELAVVFDSIQVNGSAVPLHVTVRAMADPITSSAAREPKSSDLDPDGTVTQIGGDQLTPSRAEVLSPEGDVVAYNRKGGVYAHLIASGACDAGSTEVSVDIYSPSACGLYGFTDVAALQVGSASAPSELTLVSRRRFPTIWKYSTALLEVLPNSQTVASR